MINAADAKRLADLGAVTYPAEQARALYVFAHGAGAGQRHPFMVAMATELASRHVAVVTFDFPYMRERRKIPDRAPVLESAFREVVAAAISWIGGLPLFIGGKSMGGRMATHLGAEGLDGLHGIVVFGYPLHPPGKPEQPRVAHLPSISTPVLIIQGERDTFGTPSELETAIKTMPAPVTVHVVMGGDHSLTVRSRKREELYADVAGIAARWMSPSLAPA